MSNFDKNGTFILTADVGGSHMTSSVCHLDSATVLKASVTRAEFSGKSSAKQILNSWINCLRSSIGKIDLSISGVGIAMPGPFDYQNGISYIKGLNKYEALYGLNVRDLIADGLDISPELLRFRNDAEAAIAGEWSFGAGKGYKKIMGVTLGSGFGSALTDNGVTVDLDLSSEKFKASIADDYLSTRWFLKRYYESSGISLVGVKELAELAACRQSAKTVFNEFGSNMGKVLQPVIQDHQPEALIMCGNIAKSYKLFVSELQKWITVPIQVGTLGEFSALLGALAMFGNYRKREAMAN